MKIWEIWHFFTVTPSLPTFFVFSLVKILSQNVKFHCIIRKKLHWKIQYIVPTWSDYFLYFVVYGVIFFNLSQPNSMIIVFGFCVGKAGRTYKIPLERALAALLTKMMPTASTSLFNATFFKNDWHFNV